MLATKCVRVVVCAAVAMLVAAPLLAAGVTLEVDAGGSDRVETPVHATIALPAELADVPAGDVAVELVGPDGKVPGQLVASPEKGKAELWWVVSLKAGQKATYTASMAKGKASGELFAFQDEKGDHLDLLFGDRKVTRLMYVFDPDPKKRFATAKPFTHVFDAKGEEVITSPGGNPYPHHRGIFLGYKVGAEGKRHDFWHVRNVWQRLDKFAGMEAGPVLGRMTAIVLWERAKDDAVLTEERTVTVYRQSKPEVLLDFVSVLRSNAGDLDLGGDPEHAGCQFRPHPDVAKRGKETRYVHPEGMKPGGGGTKDMPWSSVSYALRDSRFNVAHLNHPQNPKGTIYSAYRPYGRFGAYGAAKLPADQTLTLRYRIFVREGQDAALTAPEVQRLYGDFATPPKVTVKP